LKKNILKIIIVLQSIVVFSNSSIDSLFNELRKSKTDTSQINLNIKIGLEYESFLPDTSIYFYLKAQSIIDKKLSNFSENDLTDSKKDFKKYKLYNANILYILGDYYQNRGNYLKSIDYYDDALVIFKFYNEIKRISDCLNYIGLSYYYNGRYPEALTNFFESLKIREKLSDKKGCSDCLNNIGLVWYNQNNFEKASEYYSKSLAIDEELADSVGIAIGYNNIGLSYFFQLKYQKALEYYAKSIRIRKSINDKNGIAECTFNIAILYLDSGLMVESKKYLLEALSLYESLSNNQGKCAVLRELANLSNNNGDINLAINYSKECLKIAETIGLINEVRFAHSYLYSSYKALNDFKQALYHHEIYKKLTDSLLNSDKLSQISNMEAYYQNEKKQKEIELLNKEKELQKTEIKRQTTQKYAFIFGFILMLGITVLALFSYRKIKTQHKIIEHKNSELSQQNEEITAQRDEIEYQRQEISTQKDVAVAQRDLIMFQNVEITDSIKYAKRIQEAVLSSFNFIEDFSIRQFVFFKPKDIVSGDFYWFLKRGDNLIIAVADCTGHGVPGAFMSMLGISFLNEIVRKKEVTQANHVLNYLRTAIVNALQQRGIQGEQKDGMDISLIAIKTTIQSSKLQAPSEENDEQLNNRTIEQRTSNSCTEGTRSVKHQTTNVLEAQWAGANNPLWLIRNNDNKKMPPFEKVVSLEELKPDKMPIAIYEKMDSFTNHELQLQANDCIYLMTDGYQDQFGGIKNKKFLSKNLKQLLLDNCHSEMNIQKTILNSTFENWRGNNEQIDDITIIGLKV